MSQDNVEVVRRIYEDGLFDRQPEQLLALAAPEVEFVNPPEAVDAGVRRGITEVARAFQNISDSFDSTRHELHELFSAGDTVIAWVSFCTRSGGSETEIVQQEAHTWTLRGGRVVRFEWGRDLKAALEAAGLSE
jgi:ketosteroid isomerase-like protein